MKQAVYGVYLNGQVILTEPVTIPDESDVIVVFLNKRTRKQETNENALIELFDIFGPWEDSKDADDIISSIKESRVSREVDLRL